MEQRKRVIALGFFDGVHLGHGALLRQVAQRARQLGAVPAAVTFAAHPEAVILGRSAPLLTTPEQRAELMRRLYGIQDVIVAPFDDALMHMPWRDFVTDFLLERCGAVHLVAGHDFHFGYKGEGNPERLKQLCTPLGVDCDIIPPVALDGITVSSTYIRTLVAQGEMERAADFLGHPYTLTDQVRHGKKLGSRLGFPTVNLRLPPDSVTPAFGVYATQVWVDGEGFSAVTNVGVRPTLNDGDAVTVEAFLLDFQGSLYGKTVRLDFFRHLRPERKFETLDALRAQVMADADSVGRYFNMNSKGSR
jgi:riboflavin kinase/FMN adenylyltransferase